MEMAKSVDRIGIVGSFTCAIHCAICALVPGFLSFMGLDLLLSSKAEWLFSIGVLAFATVAISYGYAKHNQKKIVGTFLIGMMFIVVSRFVEESFHGHQGHHEAAMLMDPHLAGVFLSIAGGAIVAFAHVLNIRAQNCCKERCLAKSSFS